MVQKFGAGKIFAMFLKEVCYVHQGFVYFEKTNKQHIVK